MTTFQAEGAYQRFGEGDCEYACQLLQACPENSFPVITLECFTCGPLDATGTRVVTGTCQH